MSLITIPGVIEDGQIRLTENVRVPKNGIVYVVFPESDNQPVKEVHLGNARLADKSRAKFYEKVVEPLEASATGQGKLVYDPGPEPDNEPRVSVRSPRVTSPEQAERLKKRIVGVRRHDRV